MLHRQTCSAQTDPTISLYPNASNQPGQSGSRPPNVLLMHSPSLRTTRTNVKLARSKTSPADPVLSRSSTTKDVFAPQLSERDSIFATNYRLSEGDTPVTSPQQQRKEPPPERSGLIAQALQRHQVQQAPLSYETRDVSSIEQDGPDRNLQGRQKSFEREPSPVNRDGPMAALSLSPMRTSMTDLSVFFHTVPHADLHHLPYPLTSKASRHSLYDPQILTTLERPITPTNSTEPASPKGTTIDDLQSSAQRSSYRAWRQGQGRMAGKSIAESQGRNLVSEDANVDRKIDAKMPKIEQGINVRSRKTSHYLGLFKDQDSEHDKKREKRDREKDKQKEQPQEKDSQTLPAIDEVHNHNHVAAGEFAPSVSCTYRASDRIAEAPPSALAVDDSQQSSAGPSPEAAAPDSNSIPVPAPSTFEAEAEQKPLTTDNAEGRVAHQIPPSLLEEIRNHHIILGPTNNKVPSDNAPSPESFEEVSTHITFLFSYSASLLPRESQVAKLDTMQ